MKAPRHALQRVRARFVLERADLVLADAENLAAAAPPTPEPAVPDTADEPPAGAL